MIVYTGIFKKCPSKTIDVREKGIYNLQEVQAGLSFTEKCFYGGFLLKTFASIECNINGNWGQLNVSLCLSYSEVIGEIKKVCLLFILFCCRC